MTVLQLTRILRTYLKTSLPEFDVTGLTITSVQGNTVTVSGDTTGTTDAWNGGLLRIFSDNPDFELMTTAVVGNNGQTITISTPFDPVTAAALVGAPCELQGGPLRDATIFHIQPKSIKDLVESGKSIFVYIHPLDTAIQKRSLGGNDKPLHAARNQQRAFNMQIIASVPMSSGATTEETAYINQTKVYDLNEQVCARLLMFTSLNRYPISSEVELETNFGLLEPDGGAKSDIAIINFGFALSL